MIPASNSSKNSEWIVKIFEDFAIRSRDLQGRFKFGGNDEMNPDMETFPYMYVAPSDVLVSPNLDGKSGYSYVEASYDITIADKLKSDKENELQTVSDAQEILMSLIAELGTHPYYVNNNMKLVGDVNLTTSLEADDAIVSKVTAQIILRYPFKYQYCDQPVYNFEYDISTYSIDGNNIFTSTYSITPASDNTKNTEWSVAIFKDFAIRSRDLQGRFKFGGNDEMNPDMETFPYMYVAPSDVLVSPNLDGKSGYASIEATYDVTIADKLKSDKENELQTVSDAQEILMALVAELGSHPYYVANQMKLVGDVNLTTSLEADDAIVSKVTAQITLRYPFKYQYCNQPVDNIPFYPTITTDIFTSVTQSICTIIENCPVILTIDNTLIDLQNQINNISGGGTGPQGPQGPPGAGTGGVQSVTGRDVDNTDPINPIVDDFTSYQSEIVSGSATVFIYSTASSNHFCLIDTSGSDFTSLIVNGYSNPKDGAYLQILVNKTINGAFSICGAFVGNSSSNIPPSLFLLRYSTSLSAWYPIIRIPRVITSGSGLTGPQGSTGPTGPQGLPGATGQNGQSSNYFLYQSKTTITSGDPGSRHLIWNNSTQISSNQINISHITEDNIDIDIFLSLITTGNILIIQDETDSTNYQRWLVSATTSIVSNLYIEVPVNLLDSGGTGTTNFNNNLKVILAIIGSGEIGPQGPQGLNGVTGPQGLNGLDGVTGPQGPQGLNGVTGPQGSGSEIDILQIVLLSQIFG